MGHLLRMKPKRTAAPPVPSGLREAWDDPEKTLSDLCLDFYLTQAQLRSIARVNKWPERPRPTMQASIKPAADPTEIEIEERAAQVRKAWSPEVREHRFVGKKREGYVTPEYSAGDLRLREEFR